MCVCVCVCVRVCVCVNSIYICTYGVIQNALLGPVIGVSDTVRKSISTFFTQLEELCSCREDKAHL